MKIGLVRPPNLGNLVRGVGVYSEHLFQGLSSLDVDVNWLDYKSVPGLNSKFDLLHFPYFDPFFLTLPLKLNLKAVVTVHDLTPIIFPQGFPRGLKGEIKWQIQKKVLKQARAIITVSQASKNDIARLTKISLNQIFVTYEAAGQEFIVIEDKRLLASVQKSQRLPEKFLLYVGDINYNKNILTLIQAFKNFRDSESGRNYSLVLVGKSFQEANLPEAREIKKLIEDLDLSPNILFLGFVKTEDLACLYNLASAYIQPSIYEGFGLTLVEAMACGCPVICGRNSSLPEVAGVAAVYAEVDSSQDLSEKISLVIEKGKQAFKTDCLKQSKKFNWAKTAQETVKVYEKILEQK